MQQSLRGSKAHDPRITSFDGFHLPTINNNISGGVNDNVVYTIGNTGISNPNQLSKIQRSKINVPEYRKKNTPMH